MHVDDALTSRYAVRAFRPDPVPEADLRHILDLARHAPSGNNTQPWHLVVLRGAAKRRLSERVIAARRAGGKAARNYPYMPADLGEPYVGRRKRNGIALYTHLGIAKGDSAASLEQQLRNYLFFDAPVGLFFFIDRSLELGSWLDMGMFMQSVMLAARGRGLHTCPQAAWCNFHALVEEACAVPGHLMLVSGMSLGYADGEAHANGFHADREPLEDLVRFVGED